MIRLFVVCLFIISFIFQNIPFKDTIGTIGIAGANYFFPFGIYYLKKNKKTKLDKILLGYFAYMILVILFYCIISILNIDIKNMYQENIYLKSIKLIFYNIIAFTLISSFSKLSLTIKNKQIIKIFRLSIFLLVTRFIYQFFFTIGRMSLYASEPSEAGYIVIIFALISFYYLPNKIEKIFLFLFSILSLLYIGSRGSIIIAFISLLLAILLKVKLDKNKKNRILLIIGGIILLTIFNMCFKESLIISFKSDIEKFTSLATRTWSITTVLIVLKRNIIGTGGAYLHFYSEVGKEMLLLYKLKFPYLKYSEIDIMLQTGKNLAPKSGIFMEILLYGIGAIIFYVKIWKHFYYNAQQNYVLLTLLIFTIFSMLTFSSHFTTPTYVLVLVILEREQQLLLIKGGV